MASTSAMKSSPFVLLTETEYPTRPPIRSVPVGIHDTIQYFNKVS
ncbi:hypothetical protein HMPREF1549_01077 [Actinomyces johnsonii F0510]|uniref:Uncharacterized protein n=1 Tax=Actinomyces johnsonii F0510 TaxID=1227262 RepID=U1QFI1_9ACTO|nr:hypothetical protein HMPREF1549_01077 [Actinomyces johnsonii F0510]